MDTNKSFPTSIGGKGFDTAICCVWLEHYLSQKARAKRSGEVGVLDGCF